MGLFKTVKEITYDKSVQETLSDLENAFSRIGNVKSVDRESGRIVGKTRYVLDTVTIDARLEESDGKTKIIFNGKSGDVNGIGAQNKIAELVNVMNNLGKYETEIEKEKASTGRLIFMWVFAFLGGIIGIALAYSVIGAKNADGSPKYAEVSRKQARGALVLAICMTLIYVVIYNIN